MDFHVYVHFDHPDGNTVLDRILSDVAQIKQTTHSILTQGAQIMSAISDFAAKQTAYYDTIDAAVTGLTADVTDLKAQIAALQTSPGVITPEDQALLDAIDARSKTISDKLVALDASTSQAPVVPTSP